MVAGKSRARTTRTEYAAEEASDGAEAATAQVGRPVRGPQPLQRGQAVQPATAAPGGRRDPALRHHPRPADRAGSQGADDELPGAQPDAGRLDHPLQPLQEASLAGARPHLLPTPPAAGQARLRAARAGRPDGRAGADTRRHRRRRPPARGRDHQRPPAAQCRRGGPGDALAPAGGPRDDHRRAPTTSWSPTCCAPTSCRPGSSPSTWWTRRRSRRSAADAPRRALPAVVPAGPQRPGVSGAGRPGRRAR